MNEECVTRHVMGWLEREGWTILDYDFPGGGTGRKFIQDGGISGKNKGIIIPDIIAVKAGVFVIFEDKKTDTRSDYQKVAGIVRNQSFPQQLSKAYPRHSVAKILSGIAFAGEPRYLGLAEEEGVDIVVRVNPDNCECQIVYGAL